MLPPNRLQMLRNLRTANADMAFASAFGTLVTGGFLVGLIRYLNGSDLWIGLLSATPSMLGILQIPGAIWGRSKPSYKRFVLPGGLLWRAFYIPFIAIPLLPISANAKLTLAASCAVAAACSTFLVNPIYNDWLAVMVPENSRGSFFAKRNAIGTAVAASVGILGGLILDVFKRRHDELLGYSTVFGLGILAAAASFGFFLSMKDLVRENPITQNLWDGIKAFGAPFRDPGYRLVLVFLACAIVGQGFPGSLYFAYGLESLKLPFTVLQLAGAFQALGIVLSSRFWGFASDKYGNKPMLAIAGLGLAINPIPWILCRPGQLVFDTALLLCAHVFFGLVWGGVNLCQFNIMLSTAKPEDRANYLGAGMATTALVGGLAPMAGAAVMAHLRIEHGALAAYIAVFTVTALLRLVAVFTLIPVREAGSAEVITTLQHLGQARPGRVRAMRRLSRSSSAQTREAALEQLGDEGFAMAAGEVVKALYDPLPRVRRQAVHTLGQMRDPLSRRQAAEALIEQIEAHPDLAEEETIEALGTMDDSRALECLIRLLKSPRSLLRRAAARALGRLGSPGAIPALIAAYANEDADLRRVSLQALRQLDGREAGALISGAVLDSAPSVRVAAAEAAAELEISEAAPNLRRALVDFPGGSASAVAYALGAVGEFSDIPLILGSLAGEELVITRRQGLLGVARLLGVERGAYRLMLLDGMERDTAVVEAFKAAQRRSKRIQVALNHYSAGDEAQALREVAGAISHPGLRALAAQPVAESFLLAAALVDSTTRG